MRLFNKNGKKLKEIFPISFESEKELQGLVEDSLEDLFKLRFIRSEFAVRSFRIDTLCFDEDSQSFVIVEYKKDKTFSVIDQGYTYLSLLLNNKSDFVLEYNERLGKRLKRDEVDWSQSRIVFISPSFTDYQKQSVNFGDVPFRLWEVSKFSNNLLTFTEHKTSSVESISSVSKFNRTVVSKVSKEIKVYTEDYHVHGGGKTVRTPWVVDLYSNLRQRILLLEQIEIVPRKLYLSFQRGRPVVDVEIYQHGLKLTVNMKKGTLKDPNGISRDVSSTGHWGNGDYSISVDRESDLDYLMFLINQSYKDKEGTETK